MTDQPCAGFPGDCPNRVTVEPTDAHGGGVRCGCADVSPSNLFIRADQIQAVTIQPPPIIAVLGEGGVPLVAVHPDGHLEYGPGYEPDEAARRFWDGVEQTARSIQYGGPMNARINAHLKAGKEAERKVRRLDQMATAWAEQLPDTIRTATAVEAIHQVTREGA